MAMNFLEFEQPIAELEAKIEELKFLGSDAGDKITEEVKTALREEHARQNPLLLKREVDRLKATIFAKQKRCGGSRVSS